MTEKYTYYKLSSLHGSITHYYHFFYGVLIPFILEHINNLKQKRKVKYIIGDNLGNMLKLLLQLPLDINFKKFIKDFDKINVKTEFLKPMDVHPTIRERDYKIINKGWASILTYDIYIKVNMYMKYCIKKYEMNLFLESKNKKRIVIIERKKQKGFSTINYAKNEYTDIMKTSGSERRSIINHEDLVNLIKKYFENNYEIINISTEYMPLFEQYSLFNNADIVFAQHGAALANIIFMKEKTNVVEIISKVKLNGGDDWFKPISETCKIKHHQYITEEEHTEIKLKDFKNFLEKEKILLY